MIDEKAKQRSERWKISLITILSYVYTNVVYNKIRYTNF